MRIGRLDIQWQKYWGYNCIIWYRKKGPNIVIPLPQRRRPDPLKAWEKIRREVRLTDDFKEVLEIFCKYLNDWNQAYSHTYTPEDFLVWDPDNSKYGSFDVVTDVKFNGEYVNRLAMIEMSNGDDGGPSVLTVGWTNKTWIGEEEKPDIHFIMHTFDTIPICIYTDEDGLRTYPDGKFEAERKRENA